MRLRRFVRLAGLGTRMAAMLVRERVATGHVFNPLLGQSRADPYPLYARLRERDPIHRSWAIRGWIVFRHADCQRVIRDPRFSADDRNFVDYAMFRRFDEEDGLVEPGTPNEPTMLRRDPPDHTRLRSLVNKAFTPRAVERLRARIEELTDEFLTQAARRGTFDVIADFAVPFPVTVIAEMLGIPAADRAVFKKWSDHLVGALDPVARPAPHVMRRTLDEFRAYVNRLAGERRRQPAEDLLTALVHAEDAGDRLSEAELYGTVALLLTAGNETTTNLIGNGLISLLRHRPQLDRLRAEPAFIDSAVEELLRWDSPVQLTMRIPTEDVDFDGHRFAKGAAVVAVLAAANRDPAVFANPDTLDIGRDDNDHLSFGSGIHFCLGAQLARLEGRYALGEIVRRFPDIRLAADGVTWRRLTFLRGLEALPVRV
jgi:cytochrome P450